MKRFSFGYLIVLALDWVCSPFRGDWLDSALRVVSRATRYVVETAASARVSQVVVAQWRRIERLCTHTIREKLNTFGQQPRSTGALASPLLS